MQKNTPIVLKSARFYFRQEWLRKQAQSNVWEFPCRWGGVVEQRSFLSGQDRKNVADGLLSRLMHATASSSISHDGIDLRSEVEKQASSATELAGIAVTLSDVETERKKKERGPMVAYHESLESGKLRRDERQMHTVMELERVYMDLLKQHGSAKKDSSGLTLVEASTGERRKGWWSSMFLQDNSNCETVAGVKGLYMFGGVGCGKTMLMDMFAHSVPSYISMERFHFHDFMLEVHELLQEHKSTKDPLNAVARDISSKSKLLCLDEIFVNDIADATILHRLFGAMWSQGITLVATSNRHPDSLYEGGLQRQLFLPFIEMIKKKCVIHNMDSAVDYRKLAHHTSGVYFTSRNREQELYSRFMELTNKQPLGPMTIEVDMGRHLTIAKTGGCIAYSTFSELCEQPLGAADYMALCRAKHSLALAGVPVFAPATKTSAYRFVTLIDILYENKIRLLCSAEGTPVDIFANIRTYEESKRSQESQDNLIVDDNLGFVKDRTVSRLIEMQSTEYLIAHAQEHAPELLLALQEERSRKRFAKR